MAIEILLNINYMLASLEILTLALNSCIFRALEDSVICKHED